jgi:HlyD family secretion protein
MKTNLLLFIAVLIIAGCINKTGQADAYGNFEATEVMVSAETSGRIANSMLLKERNRSEP